MKFLPALIALKPSRRIEALLIGLLGMATGSVVALAVAALLLAQPAVHVVEANGRRDLNEHEGVLEMHFKLLRRQSCNSIAALWLWRWVDDESGHGRMRYWVPIATSPITLIDPSPEVQEFIIAHPLPRAVTPGQWFARLKYLDYCATLAAILGPNVRETDDIPVMVTRLMAP